MQFFTVGKSGFSTSTLPDERLNDRLVVYAAAQAADPQASTSASACGDRAAREGAYRFLENPRVHPSDIEQGHFDYTAEQCCTSKRILLIQDTSSVSVASPDLRAKLISSGNPTGFLAHSTLAVDADSGVVKGLIDQQRWMRERKAERGKKNLRRREVGLKESAKWAVSDMAARTRLYDQTQVVTVCDREADGYEIFLHHVDRNQDFVIRARDRVLACELENLFGRVEKLPTLFRRTVHIAQRGKQRDRVAKKGREGRTQKSIEVTVQACSVDIRKPKDTKHIPGVREFSLNCVRVNHPDSELEWVLLTTLPIKTKADITKIIDYYEKRWLIEEFHKWWKSGCRLEHRPFQSLGAVERMMTITAAIAVRLMSLHTSARASSNRQQITLSADEEKCLVALGAKTKKTGQVSAKEALETIARMGGWADTK